MRKLKIKFPYIFFTLLTLQLTLFGIAPSIVQAGGTIKIDDTHSVTVGMGLRSNFNITENAAPNKTSNSKDFKLESFRFYLSGQLHEIVTFEFNADYSGQGVETLQVLDGVIKFAFNDYLNIWTGRFLPPSDRSNLSGPYYLNAWDFPFVQKYPAIFAGRDEGLAIFGQVNGGQFKYQVGAFEGSGEKEVTTGANDGPNQEDNLLYAGRLTLNLLDPEPGYYNSSTYYGSKDILAIGLVGMFQEDSVGMKGATGDFTGWNIDLLAEKNIGPGVATLEGAYYDYDGDNAGILSTPPPRGTPDGPEGNGYFVLGSFLVKNKIGVGLFKGQVQPMVRYQEFSNEGKAAGDHSRLDLAVSHIINGHNARITLTYSMDEDRAGLDTDMIILGIQFQA